MSNNDKRPSRQESGQPTVGDLLKRYESAKDHNNAPGALIIACEQLLDEMGHASNDQQPEESE